MVLRSSPQFPAWRCCLRPSAILVISIGPQCTIYCMHLMAVVEHVPTYQTDVAEAVSTGPSTTTTVSCLPSLIQPCSPLPPHLHLQLPAPIFLFPSGLCTFCFLSVWGHLPQLMQGWLLSSFLSVSGLKWPPDLAFTFSLASF